MSESAAPQHVVGLTAGEVETVLAWCNAADFEGKLDEDELPLVDKLAGAIDDDPQDYARVRRSFLREVKDA